MSKKVKLSLSVVLIIAFIITMLPGSIAGAATKPTLNKSTCNILIGKSYDLNIKNKVEGSTYAWSSSNSKVASVNKVGVVKGISKGTATITCKVTAAGKTYNLSSKVTIINPATKIKIKNAVSSMKVGDTLDLNRTLAPASSNDKTTWTTSDKTIAKPDKLGKFTALKAGKVTITATTVSGVKDSVTIEVSGGYDLTITSKDIKNDKLMIANKIYNNITIDNSVGSATISLVGVTVTGTLQLESGADYTVRAVKSDIANVKVVNPEIASMAAEDDNTAPTFIAGTGTVVIDIDVSGNVIVRQSNNAQISTVTVSTDAAGNITVSLANYNGDVVINSDKKSNITINTDKCAINNLKVAKTTGEDTINIVDTNKGTAGASEIKTINIDNNAKVNIGVKTDKVVIAATVTDSSIVISQPVNTVTNNGSGIAIVTEDEGTVKDDIVGNPVSIVTPTPTPTATPTPTPSTGTPGGGVYVPTDPTTPPAPTPIPGVSVNNGVYTFDSHVASFTVNVGVKSYEISAFKLLLIPDAWSNNAQTYTVPNSIIPNANGELILKRTGTSYTYDVVVSGQGSFRLALNPVNLTVTVSGDMNFSITNVRRVYQFDDSFRGITIGVGSNTYEITLAMLYNIGTNWDNNTLTYNVPATNLVLERVSHLSTYKVTVPGYDPFTMTMDIANRSITVTGGTNVTVAGTVRTFTFGSDVTGFTVTVGNNSYNSETYVLSKAHVLEAADNWDNASSSFVVDGVTLKRTATPFAYEVVISDSVKFLMSVDVAARTVVVSGGSNFNITNIVK
jgi:uncharacterized protein YjdB